MHIKFKKKYKSITDFNETDIQDFSILLGVNGSGKTHLLKAIQEDSVAADAIPKEDILYFNSKTFFIPNQQEITHRTLDDEKKEAWGTLKKMKQKFLAQDNKIKTLIEKNEPPYEAKIVQTDQEQYNKIIKEIFGRMIEDYSDNNPKIKKLLKTGILRSGKYISEIEEVDFFQNANYDPDSYELLKSLSEIFLAYHKKLTIKQLPKDQGGDDLKGKDLKKLEDQSPWNFINNMFKEFGLQHTIKHPTFNMAQLLTSQALSFQAKLFIDDEEIDFEDLSSGEKILCALAITIYQDNRSQFPRLLLLDEIDASLHPSMIQNLLDVIENTFIKNDCKVILATHSPTTVALAQEEALFEIKKGKVKQKIANITKADAVSLLSEGFMTLGKVVKIFETIFSSDLTIISEGRNREHIEKAIKILEPDLLKKIHTYKHDASSGDSDLCGLMEFIKKTQITNKVLFVWDCDSIRKVYKKTETKNISKFCFSKNSKNNICSRGIENLYPEDLFTDDMLTIIPSDQNGTEQIKKEFKNANKKTFLDKIKSQSNKAIFENFQPLIEKIKALI